MTVEVTIENVGNELDWEPRRNIIANDVTDCQVGELKESTFLLDTQYYIRESQSCLANMPLS